MKHSRIVVATAIGGLALPLAAGSGGAATAAPAWSSTATKAQTVALWPGMTDQGPLASSTSLTVTLSVPLTDAAGLGAGIAAGKVLTHDQFMEGYAPSPATTGAVVSYLQTQGFTGIGVSADRLLVTATGPVSDVDAAFDTSVDSVTFGGASYYANSTGASVPDSLAGSVTAVLGLDDLPATHLAAAPAAECSGSFTGVGETGTLVDNTLCTFNPPNYQTIYDATSVPTGADTDIAVFAEGALGQVVTDLGQERSDLGLPPITPTVVQPAADTVARTDTSGQDEFDLDSQSSSGMAQTVHSLTLYDASSLDSGPLTDGFDSFAVADAQRAGSASFGGCDVLAFADGETAADDPIFEEAASQGQTVFASSGDTGTACLGVNGAAAGVPGVEYPASSPWVVGVGGTSLLPTQPSAANANTYTYDTELAWTGSGGGFSYVEPAPTWQAGETTPYGNLSQTTGKTVPDVADVADPNNGGMWVDVSGTYEGVGGTSLASPLTLGEWARIESDYGNSLGFAAPILYKLEGTSAFHDVTLGDSGYYPAAPGYDLATGLGSLDVAQAAAQIAANGLGTVSGGETPPSDLPETPLAIGLPAAALAMVWGAWRVQRRRPKRAR